jgi:hypothetical protein
MSTTSMRRRSLVIAAIAIALSLQGCLMTPGNLRRETARMIVPSPYPDSVTVSEVHRLPWSVSWVATNAGNVYDCSSDDKLKRTLCVKRPTSKTPSEGRAP